MPHMFVIPVSSKGRLTSGQKTGIQSIMHDRNNVVLAWIPASAGMTVEFIVKNTHERISLTYFDGMTFLLRGDRRDVLLK